MRYRDASHVDVGAFYARLPRTGASYRLLGYAGILAVAWCSWRHQTGAVGVLLVALILVWLAAWYQVVGTLWRSSLVAAIIAAAVYLSCERLVPAVPRAYFEVSR